MTLGLILLALSIFLSGAIAGMRYRRRELEDRMTSMNEAQAQTEQLGREYRQALADLGVTVAVSNGRTTVEHHER